MEELEEMNELSNYQFADGSEISIVLGEDGYNVNVIDSNPLMGTFTSFEELLYGIAPVLQEKIDSMVEMECFAIALSESFKTSLSDKEMLEIIMK